MLEGKLTNTLDTGGGTTIGVNANYHSKNFFLNPCAGWSRDARYSMFVSHGVLPQDACDGQQPRGSIPRGYSQDRWEKSKSCPSCSGGMYRGEGWPFKHSQNGYPVNDNY